MRSFSNRSSSRTTPNSYGIFNPLSGTRNVGGSSKTYRIDVPVYAAPSSSTQDEWSAIEHSYEIYIGSESKTYSVKHNLANSASSSLYPVSGETPSYFPKNTWGFAVSTRNLKQYNYQMLIDSLIWENYSVTDMSINWTPQMGAFQAGAFDCVLVNNAQAMPSEPYTNQANSVHFNATEQKKFAFEIFNGTVPIKNTRCVNSSFDQTGDFGILWVRTTGFGSSITSITEVGQLTINIGVSVAMYAPAPQAQLIGPWIEAGYPIDGSGTTTLTSGSKVNSSMLLAPSELGVLKGRKAQNARWRMAGKTGDKHVVSIGGSAVALHTEARRCLLKSLKGAKDESVDFPNPFTVSYDMGVTGADFAAKAVFKASQGEMSDEPMCVSPCAGAAQTNTELVVNTASNNTKLIFMEDPQDEEKNSTMAGDPVVMTYSSSAESGATVGCTLKMINSYEPGAAALIGDTADANSQVAGGYTTGIGQCDTGVTLPSVEDSLWGTALKFVAGGVAGLGSSKGAKGASLFSASLASQYSSASAAKASFSSNETNETVTAQAVQYVVPDDATYRSSIGEYTDTTTQYFANNYFGGIGAISTHGLTGFTPASLSSDVSRISINGQSNTVISAMTAVSGAADVTLSPVSMNTQCLMVLAMSRYNPLDDNEKFFKSAVAVTPLLDGVTQAYANSNSYVNKISDTTSPRMAIQSTSTTTKGSQTYIKASNEVLISTAMLQSVIPSVCNFTVPWPDKLISIDDDEEITLTALEAGETVYVTILRSMMIDVTHTKNEPVSSPATELKFYVFPSLAESGAMPALSLNISDDGDNCYDAITKSGTLSDTIQFMEEAERRFCITSAAPSAEA